MQPIKKCKNAPASLRKKKDSFLAACKGRDIWMFYRDNKNKYDYRTSETKRLLLEASENRCAICSKCIYDSKDLADKNSPNAFTIEHIVPKQENPYLIFDWDNMLPCCVSCNEARGAKEYKKELYVDPCTTIGCDTLFSFSFDGGIYSSNKNQADRANYMIALYNLNGDSKRRNLKSQRKWYYKMLISDDYHEMVKVNKELGLSDNIIIFKDMFLFFERFI